MSTTEAAVLAGLGAGLLGGLAYLLAVLLGGWALPAVVAVWGLYAGLWWRWERRRRRAWWRSSATSSSPRGPGPGRGGRLG